MNWKRKCMYSWINLQLNRNEVKSDLTEIKKSKMYNEVNNDIYDMKDNTNKVRMLEEELSSFDGNKVKKMIDVYNSYKV